MEITEVKVFPVEEEDLKVISGKNGMFVAMPSKKTRDGSFKDIAHPLNSETRQAMEEVILSAYEQELASRGRPSEPRGNGHQFRQNFGESFEQEHKEEALQ